MAVENVKKFFELVKSDEKLSREIAKIKDEIQNKGETVDYEQIISKKVIPLAKKHGLDFTMEDFLKYTNSVVQQGELSDDNLLNVSGGMNLRQGLATGFLLLSVGTTGLGLMANNIVGNGGGSSTGGQGAASTPITYSQSIGNDTEDEEVVDTENDEREDNEFNDEDDAVPATEGVSMDMLGAGMFDVSEDEVDTQGGAGESASTNKNVAGSGAADVGATSSASTNKNVAGGGVAGGAAKSTTATKTTAGGGTAGGAAGATTATKKDEAAKPGAEAAKKDEAKKDEAAKKDETKEETKTETGKKSEEAKKDEAAKTEATEKQEYNKFGDFKWHWWGTTWQDIGNHILGELNNVGLDINNFSNPADAISDIGAFVKDAEKVDEDTYNKIKTSYDNYTAEVEKKDLAKKVAEEAAKKAAEEEAKKEINDLVEAIKSGNDEKDKLDDFWENSSLDKQGIHWKGCVLSGSDAIVLLNAASKESTLDYTGGNAFTVALFNESAQDVKDAEISDLKDLSNKLDEGIKAGNTADWPQELKDRLENFKTGLKNVISEKEEAAKKEAEAKKAAEEAAEEAAKKAEEEAAKKAAEEAAKKKAEEKAANAKKKEEALKTPEAQKKRKERADRDADKEMVNTGDLERDILAEAKEEEAAKKDYTAISVEESGTDKKMSVKEKVDYVYNYIKDLSSIDKVQQSSKGNLWGDISEVLNEVNEVKDNWKVFNSDEDLAKVQKLINFDAAFNKVAKAAKKAAARKAAMEKEIENLEWDIENLSDEGTDEKMNVVERLMKVRLDSEDGKNVSEDSKAKLESEVLKLGLILYNSKNKNFDIGSSYPNGSSFVALYKEASKGLPTYNKFVGKSDEDKANYIVQNLEKFGDDYRMNYESKGELVSDLKDLKDKIVTVGGVYKLQITKTVYWWLGGTRTEVSDKVSSENLKKILRACNELGV